MSVLDREQLRDVTLDDRELMREVLSQLIDDTSRQIYFLDLAIRRRNAGETVRLAHCSRGACANVGARATAAVLQHIERTAVEGDFSSCGMSLEALAGELDRLRAEAGEL